MTSTVDSSIAMDLTVAQGFASLRDELRTNLPADALDVAGRLLGALPDWQRSSRFGDLGPEFLRVTSDAQSKLPELVLHSVNRLVVVELALRLGASLSQRCVTPDVLALVPASAARLLTYLRGNVDTTYAYPDDHFLKDLRFAAGMTVPGGAEVFDLRSRIGTRAAVAMLRRQPSLAHLWAILTRGSLDPWFRIHTESRYLRHFHDAGWEAFYLRVASMLSAHRGVYGVVGTSWFFDPQLAAISPRLGYLLKPLASGAFLVRGRTSDFDIASATTSSETRKQLFLEGRYLPVPHTLVWPKAEILAWARQRIEKVSSG